MLCMVSFQSSFLSLGRLIQSWYASRLQVELVGSTMAKTTIETTRVRLITQIELTQNV